MNARPDIATRPARILLVDDDRHNRRLLESLLGPEGFHILTAASGEEALALVALQAPDLILLDIMMPGMDGYQVAARIKGDPATRNIPIIMVTALNDRSARMLGLKAGAEDFLSKPVDCAELCVRVRNLLRLKAYGDYHDQYSQMLEVEVGSRTADLLERTKTLELQAGVLTAQAALLDLAPDAIIVQDMCWRILFWSHGAEVMYGWSSEEALGRNTRELLRIELSTPENIEATLLGHGQWAGEAAHYTRDGTRLTVATRWALQRNLDGAPIRILSISNDISDRKQAEADRKNAEDALEQNRKDQMRFKDEFLSHVSHELRSPLTAVKQFTTILLGGVAGELNKDQREYQQIILKNIQQLQSMIDDLLEVTRLETGKLTVEPESVSVSDAVADTFNTLQANAGAKGIRLSSDLPPDLPSAYVDHARLRQILVILLDNAIRFTPSGGAAHIQARLVTDDPQFLLVEVSDTGRGISPEITERIFEPVHHASESAQDRRKGKGLGLYICKELVTRQGGRIWAKRKPQKGSIFSFTLPVFSLSNSIAPLLKNDRWPAESVALVMTETRLLDTWPSRESRKEWSHEARALVQRCLLPDLDVLLPRMSVGTEGEHFYVAAFADEKGASVLANRIRGQFERILESKQTGLTVSVSYSMLDPVPAGAGATMETLVTRMATNLEESIKSHLISREHLALCDQLVSLRGA